MNTLVVIFAVASCCFALPQFGKYHPVPSVQVHPGHHVAILKQSQDVDVDGSYQYSYETENGISAQEHGSLKHVHGPEPVAEVRGAFQYTAPDGTPIVVQYVADENGFQPQGAHLPVAPPIPEAILKSLAYNAAHPEEEQPVYTKKFF